MDFSKLGKKFAVALHIPGYRKGNEVSEQERPLFAQLSYDLEGNTDALKNYDTNYIAIPTYVDQSPITRNPQIRGVSNVTAELLNKPGDD